jgi:two-component sensor histidine kinase
VRDVRQAVRLLYIDDDSAFGRLVQRSLGRQGMTVTFASGGDDGLARLREETFDIVALDHFMPGKEGLEVLGEIRSLAAPPPVIYVTGADEGRIAVAALKNGAADYIVKDVGGAFFDLLTASINQALEQECTRRAKEAAEQEVREARDRAELLLREVNHRVANSLQLVASLVSMQKSMVVDEGARNALVETQSRISAIAQIHRRLYTSMDVANIDMDAYLGGLVEELDQAMRATGSRSALKLVAEPIEMPTDKAISLAVIVVELVTNAAKYAYPDGAEGEVRIVLNRDGAGVQLAVEDDGVGYDGASLPQGSGLGGRIISAMATNLRTQIAFDQRHRGTRAVLRFSLEDAQPEPLAATG